MATACHYRSFSAWLLLLLLGCDGSDPFEHVPVSGKVTYEDGTPIPVADLVLTFYPQTAALNAKTHPRPGTALVDRASGAFAAATTHEPNDGLIRGKHKVTLTSPAGPIPPSTVPPEYGDLTRTPLEVDTEQRPLTLSVRRP